MRLLAVWTITLAWGVLLAQPGLRNGDFEKTDETGTVSGWYPATASATPEWKSEGCHTGHCATFHRASAPASESFTNLMQSIQGREWRGKMIRLSGWVKVEGDGREDVAQLWLRVDRTSREQKGFFENMDERPIRAGEWKRYEITGRVDEDAANIALGVFIRGKARVWVDNFELAVPVMEDAARKVQAELQEVQNRMATSAGKGDAQPMIDVLAPGATLIVDRRRESLRDRVERFRSAAAGMKHYQARTPVEFVEIEKETAHAWVNQVEEFDAGNGVRRMRSLLRNSYVQGNDWKLVESRIYHSGPLVEPMSAGHRLAIVRELKSAVVPLKGVKAGTGFEDLAAFGRAVGKARIVALGEATHGTKEFFQMKHRLLEYLVTEKGFTVFAIEANYPEALAADAYVKSGTGDARAALRGMYFWTWNTLEVLDMIEWMREYNKTAAKKLTFTSFDMQMASVAAQKAAAYLKKVEGVRNTAWVETLEEAALLENRRADLKPEEARPVAERLSAVVKDFDANQQSWSAQSSAVEWLEAKQAAEVARQALELKAAGTAGHSLRDERMAQNVDWLLHHRHPGEKMVLWAHNGHVSKSGYGQVKSMGQWLAERWGAQMHVLGFGFHHGELRAFSRERAADGSAKWIHKAPPIAADTGGGMLFDAGIPLFYLDLRQAAQHAVLGQLVNEPHQYYSSGSVFSSELAESFWGTSKLAGEFDSLVWVEESHASEAVAR